MLFRLPAVLLAFLLATPAFAQVEWIWPTQDREAGQRVCLQREFTLEELPLRAEWFGLADFCYSRVIVNGSQVQQAEPYGQAAAIDVTDQLRVGTNTISICCRSVDGPAAAMGRLRWETADGWHSLATDSSWRAIALPAEGGLEPPARDAARQQAISLGAVQSYRYGLDQPSISIQPADDYTQWKRAIDAQQGTDPRTFETVPGFQVELIHSATPEEGSWVSLAADPTGGWIVGIEKQGLLRIIPATEGQPARTERSNDTLHECRGLQFRGHTLYALANNDKALYRLRDGDHSGGYESVEKLFELGGDVGHGRNQLTLGSDGQLYGIFGDAVIEPETLSALPPALAHASPAEQTRSGFVIRFEEDVAKSQVLVRGLRNPYGLAINQAGDMFTYDADAEYDMGASWYRPTRVLHLLPGADYRWRRVTKQWPPYFPDQADMPQPTLDIGKGSPTAVTFGSGENFPPRYRQALYILDWAYGRIVTVHLTPRGSSYYATPETFLRGQPLNVTDVEFGPDGAMYFVTGGRGTQSALYRVCYVGAEVTEETSTRQDIARQLHARASLLSRQLLNDFAAHPQNAQLGEIWDQLGSEAPWIRHAARTALEVLPYGDWHQQALDEQDPAKALACFMAIVRTSDEPPVEQIARYLIDQPLAKHSQRLQLEWLFLTEQLLSERFDLSKDSSEQLRAAMRNNYPATTWEVNRHLGLLLSERPDEQFVPATMRLLEQAVSQEEKLHYMFLLRHAKTGWTNELRLNYFAHLQQLADFVGGEGMPTFRKLIREEALASIPASERPPYQALLEQAQPSYLEEIPTEPRELVQQWKLADFASDSLQLDSGRDLANGRKIFAAAACIRCHRFGGRGDFSGPDLTAVSSRFTPRDMLVSMLEPSRVVAEKYASHSLEMADGRVLTGRIAPGDYRSAELELVPNQLEAGQTIRVQKADIVEQRLSPTSPMPAGLLDTFTREEILDLLAYLTHSQR